MMAYLVMMAVRLIHMRRILKPTGSIYVHCDPTASHYLKLLMDVLFGRANFQNEVIWSYGLGGSSWQRFSKKHDVILFYSKQQRYHFDKPMVPATSQRLKGKLKGATDVWEIPAINNMAKERVGYPTQKPLALLDRIIKASCPPDGIVLDPFCGCATTLVAAERLGRQWAGIDLSPLAVKLVKDRLKQEMGMFYDIVHRTDIPRRTDMGKLPNYRTHKHQLYGKQEGNCYGCKSHFPFRNLTVDHIVPKAYGGSDHYENLQLLCGWCNSKKGTRSQEEFLAEMARTG
jgi:site-specific DNA-methyltransferase (adenine-specific)